MLAYVQSVEKALCWLAVHLCGKEVLQHGESQGLPKTARAGDKGDVITGSYKAFDKEGLIHKDAAVPFIVPMGNEFMEAIDAAW